MFIAEDAEWWNGAWQLGARVFLAACLTITGRQTAQAVSLANAHQDDPAARLSGTSNYDEPWQNPVAPVPGSLGKLYLPDPEEIPVGKLTATVDEYFWQNPWQPCLGQFKWPQQYAFDEQTPALSATVDEYFWQNPWQPCLGQFKWPQQWPFDEQIPAGNLSATVDEYFWNNPVWPVSGTLQPLPLWSYDEQIPILFGRFDEDFWQNPVFPVAGSLQALPLWAYDEQIPSPVFDEDNFWRNPAPLGFAPWVQLPIWLFDPAEIVPQPAIFPPDEDFWQSFVRPIPPNLYQPLPYLFDSGDIATLARVVVTGHLEYLSAANLPNGRVIFVLSNFDVGTLPTVRGTATPAQLIYVVQSTTDGNFSTQLWGNDSITPAGTKYNVTFQDSLGNEVGPIVYTITGASVSLNNLAPG